MKHFRLATVVSLLCLVSFAASAAAECAWVLWVRLDRRGAETPDAWTHRGVYPTYSKCWAKIHQSTGISEEGSLGDWMDWMRSRGRYDERMRGIDLENMKGTDIYTSARESGAMVMTAKTTFEYECLPDTLDPRGPKGE